MTTLPDPPLPSTASYILATFILAACAGYFLGQASSLGLLSRRPAPNPNLPAAAKSTKNPSWPNSYDVAVHPDSSDEELMTHLRGGKKGAGAGVRRVGDSEEEDGSGSGSGSDGSEDGSEGARGERGALKSFEENEGEECKLVLVVRTDLGMGKGKIAAQCSHATLACYKHLLSSSSSHSSHSSHPSSPSLLRRWESTGQAKIALQVPSADQLELLRARARDRGLCARVVRDAGRTQVASGSATVLGVGPGPRSVVDGVTGGLRLL